MFNFCDNKLLLIILALVLLNGDGMDILGRFGLCDDNLLLLGVLFFLLVNNGAFGILEHK